MKYVTRPIPESGIPLGGIGTGSVEIRADGRFYEWQIFNNKPWRCGGAPWEREKEEFMRPNEFFFTVRAKPKGEVPIVRILCFGAMDLEHGYDPYTLPWVKGVESIEYVGEYPFAVLNYLDENLPVRVKLEAFSPFIPGEMRDSSLPAAVFVFKLNNPTDKPVEASVLACLKNPVGRFVQGRRCVNKVFKEAEMVAIQMSAEGVPENHPTYRGSIALTVLDPEASFQAGLPARNQDFKKMWVDLRSDGLLESGQLEASSFEEIYGLLCSKTSLEPGEEKEIVFILSWFFPNYIDTRGNLVGHMYENWFKDASDVAAYAASNLKRLRGLTRLFHETLYDTSLDYWIVDAVSAQLTTLVKSSFFTKDGVFRPLGGWTWMLWA